MSSFDDALRRPEAPSNSAAVPATRRGRKHVGVYLVPGQARQLQALAALEGTTAQALIEQAVTELRPRARTSLTTTAFAGRVSGHSLRVGSAQSLAAAGAGLVELQEAGDWQAPTMPAHYARHQFAARGAVAKLRYRQGA